MPTEAQLRVQAYSAVVFGASGIVYFALDSWVARVGQVVGMGPRTPYMTSNQNGGGTPVNASQSDRHASRLLWHAATRLNAELTALAPAILSPTSDAMYTVAFSGNNMSATPLRSVLKKDPTRGLVLLAVNVDTGTVSGRFSFESSAVPAPAGSTVRVLFEGLGQGDAAPGSERTVDVVKGGSGWGFVDTFGGFESHAFVL